MVWNASITPILYIPNPGWVIIVILHNQFKNQALLPSNNISQQNWNQFRYLFKHCQPWSFTNPCFSWKYRIHHHQKSSTPTLINHKSTIFLTFSLAKKGPFPTHFLTIDHSPLSPAIIQPRSSPAPSAWRLPSSSCFSGASLEPSKHLLIAEPTWAVQSSQLCWLKTNDIAHDLWLIKVD